MIIYIQGRQGGDASETVRALDAKEKDEKDRHVLPYSGAGKNILGKSMRSKEAGSKEYTYE